MEHAPEVERPCWPNVRSSTWPVARSWLNLQFPPYAVTVCVPLIAFHLTVSPVEMRTVVGDQWVTIAFTVFVVRRGVLRSLAAAPVVATAVRMRNTTRKSDVRMRRVDMPGLPFDYGW